MNGLLLLATETGAPIDLSGWVPAYAFAIPYDRIGLSLEPDADGIRDLALLGDGSLKMAYDSEAVGQHARQRIMTHSQEWFLDTECGIPWLDQILGRREDLPLAEALVKAEIMNTDGVTGITGVRTSFDRRTRGINIGSATVVTEYDEEASV